MTSASRKTDRCDQASGGDPGLEPFEREVGPVDERRQHQNSRFVLADCDTTASVGWAFLDQCIAEHLKGELDITGAAKAKMWLTDNQSIVADRCLQLFGGYGFMREYPISQLFVDARVQRIYGGSNEIMKELVSRAL